MPDLDRNLRLKRQLHYMRPTATKRVSRQFDWASARKQLESSQASLLMLEDDTPEALNRLWKQRAAQLARPPAPEAVGEQLPVIVVRLGREQYGLDVQYVRAVAGGRAITHVPRVPPWVAGIVTQHGHIVAVIDLPRFVGAEVASLPSGTPPPESYLVNIQTADTEVALLVDEVLGLEVIPIDQLRPLESAPRNFRTEFVRGVSQREEAGTADLLIVLNLPALLTDDRLMINETL